MKKKITQLFIVFALILIIAISFLIKQGFVHIPTAQEFINRPFYSILHIIKPGKSINEVYRDSNMYVYPPSITRYYENSAGELTAAKPDPIVFYFNSSAANINLVGSEIKNISISPKTEGVWKWENEYSLTFNPKNDWPAGEDYKIKFPKEIFNDEYPIEKLSYNISTPKFEAKMKNFQLFQDPKNPKVHQLQAEFSFTHPADPVFFEKNINIKIDKKSLPFSISYDKLQRNAYIVSDPVKILSKDQTALIELNSAKAATGGKAIKDKISVSINIPSQDKFFRIARADAIMIRNKEEDPEQFLEIIFTDGVDVKELSGKVKLYLLPIRHPDNDKNINHYAYGIPYSYQWNFSEITPEILARSKMLDIELMEDPDPVRNTFMYKYTAPDLAKRYLYIQIEEGINSQIDFVMKKPYQSVIESAAFPKEVSLLQNGAILPLEGSKMITFKTRGLNGVKVDIAKVMPDQINHLVSQTYGTFANPNFMNNYTFNETNISQSFSTIIPLNIAISKANYSSIDMSQYLSSNNSSGLFFIKVQGYNVDNKSYDGPSDKRFILATDLAMLVKKDKDKHHIFIMSIKSGNPVAYAKIQIIGKNGIPVLTDYTNEQGYTALRIEGFHNEQQPVAYLATKGNDISFMPFERYDRNVDFSKFDISGKYSASKNKGMQAFIFSDRGIYRPGDDMNFGIIIKNEDWNDISGIPVKFVLKDPYGKNIFEKTVTLNNTGFLTVDSVKTYNVSPTGTYSANIYLVEDRNRESLLGTTSVRVEEFRTDTIKVNANITGTSGRGWALPENLKALVTVNNFFGTPAQDRMVKASYSMLPTEFRFSKYPGFRFPDPYKLNNRNAIQSISEKFTDTRTNDNGETEFVFDMSKYSGGTYNLIFSAEAFEGDSGKSVYAYDSTRLSPYKYLLGYKTASKLSYLNKGSDASIDIITVDNDLKPLNLKNLKIKVSQTQYISSLVKQNNGVYKYQTTTKETIISEDSFSVSAKGSRIKLNTQNPGNFVLHIEDENGIKLLSIMYFVAGSSNQAFTIEKDAHLMINLQNDEVESGGQLTLNITAPYTGTGLITIEKDKVYTYKWFTTDSNSTIQTITVPKELEGNGYVNVSFIRSIDSREIFLSPHSYAVVPFKVNLSKRKVNIDLKTPETIRPGDELEISYKTSDNAKIVVYAADQGILQVADYKTPDPLAFFFSKGALETETFQTVDLILPDYKIIKEISGIGGGDGYEMIEKNLNPFARKQHKPAVFWSATLDATNQYRTVKYKVPDYFNGQLKIMAVAATPDKAGSAETDLTVKSPVIISPLAPLAAINGDTFEVSATVSNNIDGSGSAILEIWLESNDKFEIIGINKQTLDIKEGGEKTVRFNLKTLDKLGSGDLVFKARYKDEIFKSEVSISIRPAYAYRTSVKSGFSKKKSFKVTDFTRNMYDEFSNREFAVSYNPQLTFLSLKRYFTVYPYGCTEQIISSVFPFLYGTVSERKGFIKPEEQQKMFDTALSKIHSRQQSSGGFSLWQDSSNVHIFSSIYAMHFFTDSKELGYPVPQQILSRGKNWLEFYASELPKSLEEARMIAYANYVLTRNNYITTANLLRLETYLNDNHKKWHEDIVSSYLAACYSLLKDHKKANKLINGFKADTKDKFIFYSDYDSSSQRNAAYLYLCSKHFPQNFNADAQSIADGLVQTILDGKYNTISSSSILLALLSYGSSLEGKDENLSIAQFDGKGKETETIMKSDPFPYINFMADAKEFHVSSKEDAGKIYYSVIQQGFDKNAKEYSQNLEITRDYIFENGNIVKTANIGDNITVRIRLRAKSNNYITVAIVDLLPACFEIISGSQKGNYQSSDAREDRMIFYTSAGSNITEITYKVKVITKGNFTVPGIYASGLYDPDVSALTKQSSIEIIQPDVK